MCPCGTVFTVRRKRYESGRGRYCSRSCQNRYQDRLTGRIGLIYVKHKDNPTSIKPGQRLSPATAFQRGQDPWNKGVQTGQVPPNAFKPGDEPWNKGSTGMMPAGPAHPHWVGDDVGYQGLHTRLQKGRGPASAHACSHADETCKGPLDWANVSGEYRGTEDFFPLCRSHHIRYDRARVRPS